MGVGGVGGGWEEVGRWGGRWGEWGVGGGSYQRTIRSDSGIESKPIQKVSWRCYGLDVYRAPLDFTNAFRSRGSVFFSFGVLASEGGCQWLWGGGELYFALTA